MFYWLLLCCRLILKYLSPLGSITTDSISTMMVDIEWMVRPASDEKVSLIKRLQIKCHLHHNLEPTYLEPLIILYVIYILYFYTIQNTRTWGPVISEVFPWFLEKARREVLLYYYYHKTVPLSDWVQRRSSLSWYCPACETNWLINIGSEVNILVVSVSTLTCWSKWSRSVSNIQVRQQIKWPLLCYTDCQWSSHFGTLNYTQH